MSELKVIEGQFLCTYKDLFYCLSFLRIFPILLKLSMIIIIMKTHIFNRINFDPKGH